MTHPIYQALRRWSNFEPAYCNVEEVCEAQTNIWVGVPGNRFLIYEHKTGQPTEMDLVLIQRAVLHAITNRTGWDLTLQTGLDLKNQLIWFAVVRRQNGLEFYSGNESDAAIALLAAYVNALEASPNCTGIV